MVLAKLGEWFVALKNWIISSAPGWGAALLGWGVALWRWIVEAVPLALSKLGEWLGALGSWFLENYPKLLAAVYRWQAGMWQWIADSLPGVIRAFTDWVLGVTEWSKSDGSSRFGEVMRNFGNALVTEVWPAMKEFLIALKNAFVAIMPELIEAAAKIGVAIMFAIAQGLLNMLGIDVNLMEVRNTILRGLDGIGPAVFGAAANIGRSFLDGIASMSPVGSLNGMVDGVINSFNGKMDGFKTHVLSVLIEVGQRVGEGLKEGIKRSVQWVIDALKWLTDFLPQWVRDALGIHSPSRVFMDIGSNIMAGLTKGIEAMKLEPQLALASAVEPMVGSTTNNNRTTNNNFQIALPTTGGNRSEDQLLGLLNTLTAVYAQ